MGRAKATEVASPATIEAPIKDRPLAIERRHAADLSPYAKNARTHSPDQVEQIVASIREFGFTNPILVDEHDGVIAGHGRLLAARKMGLAEVPVIVLAGLTEAQKRAYVLADNKLALNAGWEPGLLSAEFAALKALDFDLNLTGFSLDEVAAIGEKANPTAPGEFRQYDFNVTTTYECPKCGYKWS